MKTKNTIFAVLAFCVAQSVQASGTLIREPHSGGGVLTPHPIIVVQLANALSGHPVLWLTSDESATCTITQAEATSLGTTLFELARMLAPKSPSEGVNVDCEEGASPGGELSLRTIEFKQQ